jgi:site-specific recombinase XerD
MTPVQAWQVLQDAYEANGLSKGHGTHAMRKTFANRVYNYLDRDLVKTQAALGHKAITSTVSYLSFAQSDVRAAILGC